MDNATYLSNSSQNSKHSARSEWAPPFSGSRIDGTRPGRSSRRWRSLRTACLVVGCVIVTSAAIAKKERVVAAVPQASGLYAAFGLSVNQRGLKISDVRSTLTVDGPQKILMVTGNISNVGGRSREAPEIRLAVQDENRREIYHWTTPSPKQELTEGESVEFRARLLAAPEEASAIEVTFVDRSGRGGRR
jgi:hypothetical protein